MKNYFLAVVVLVCLLIGWGVGKYFNAPGFSINEIRIGSEGGILVKTGTTFFLDIDGDGAVDRMESDLNTGGTTITYIEGTRTPHLVEGFKAIVVSVPRGGAEAVHMQNLYDAAFKKAVTYGRVIHC